VKGKAQYEHFCAVPASYSHSFINIKARFPIRHFCGVPEVRVSKIILFQITLITNTVILISQEIGVSPFFIRNSESAEVPGHANLSLACDIVLCLAKGSTQNHSTIVL